ncbi:MAG: hypothetical protein LGR52_02075 [Candidatus Thiosymbion ectosymbiont of Robbea hypermnestra]|nr:hypothetical protein [Candidatus Thiosymbion ectosymbiont of Robbea hypermnestra]
MKLTEEEHHALVDKEYSEVPECYREKFRESIYIRKVVEGMWPTEVLLAGGGGLYRVKADDKKWEKGSNPMVVMKAQCTEPDNSEIEIDFQNSYQFAAGDVRKFTVRFKNGIAVEIKEN